MYFISTLWLLSAEIGYQVKAYVKAVFTLDILFYILLFHIIFFP